MQSPAGFPGADIKLSPELLRSTQQLQQQTQQAGFGPGPSGMQLPGMGGGMPPPGSNMPPPASRPGSGMMPPPPSRKRTEEDDWVLPRRGVQQALRAAGLDKDFRLEPGNELHGALMELYGTLIENAVQFGCSNARMRKSQVLKPRDMAVYLERTWGISVPGFSGEQVRAHRRPAVSEVHRRRLTASRQVVNDTLPRRGGAAAAAAAANNAGPSQT